mgnify:CR=1 FL=1
MTVHTESVKSVILCVVWLQADFKQALDEVGDIISAYQTAADNDSC